MKSLYKYNINSFKYLFENSIMVREYNELEKVSFTGNQYILIIGKDKTLIVKVWLLITFLLRIYVIINKIKSN